MALEDLLLLLSAVDILLDDVCKENSTPVIHTPDVLPTTTLALIEFHITRVGPDGENS